MANRLSGRIITHLLSFCLLLFTFFLSSFTFHPSSVFAQTYCVCGDGTNWPPMYCTGNPQTCSWERHYVDETSIDPSGPYMGEKTRTWTPPCTGPQCGRAYTEYWVCTGTERDKPHRCDPDSKSVESWCYASGVLACGENGPGVPGPDPIAPPGATPTSTPIPTPSPTPAPLSSIRVRGVLTSTYHTLTCDQVRALTTGITGAQFRVDGPMWHSNIGTQTGSTYVDFLNQALPGTQTVSYEGTTLLSYGLDRACWTKSTGESGVGLNVSTAGTETATFDLSFVSGVPFFQTQGGNVYTGGSIISQLPINLSPRYVAKDPTVGSPGIVAYGSSDALPYDFSIGSVSNTGRTYVSSKGWLAHSQIPTKSLYTEYSHRVLSGADVKHVYDPTLRTNGKPLMIEGEKVSIYTYNADGSTPGTLTLGDTSGTPWVIDTNEKIILVVDGNVTIRSPITITGNGFFMLIAKGSISIDPTVGGAWNSVTPVIEGVYVAGTAFNTGLSTTVGKERLVIRGSVIADTMTLERDLSISGVNHNADASAELFIHSPRLVLAAPSLLNDHNYLWQEVNP